MHFKLIGRFAVVRITDAETQLSSSFRRSMLQTELFDIAYSEHYD